MKGMRKEEKACNSLLSFKSSAFQAFKNNFNEKKQKQTINNPSAGEETRQPVIKPPLCEVAVKSIELHTLLQYQK